MTIFLKFKTINDCGLVIEVLVYLVSKIELNHLTLLKLFAGEMMKRSKLMRSKLKYFRRLKVSIIFHNFDQEVDTSIMRLKAAKNE